MSVASVLSSPKVYCIERQSLESEQQNEEVGEPYRYSVMNTMWIRSKAPNSKYSVRGTELLFPGTILRLKAFFFSRNLSIGGAQPSFKPQSPARDVKPFSMSSTRPVDPGGKGNPLIESILDAVPLTRPTHSPNATRLFRGMAFNPLSIYAPPRPEGGLNPIPSSIGG